MNIIVFGANGGIGIQTVEQGLEAGHAVTAIARRPDAVLKLRPQLADHPNLRLCQGDVFDISSFDGAMHGQDAVISALGTAKSEPTTLYSEGMHNILRVMQDTGVRRVFCISASGLEPTPLLQRLIAKPMLWRMLHDMYVDLVRMEDIVKASTADWTIVRPPMLSDKPRTGKYNVGVNRGLRGGYTISRADVADYMLTHLSDPSTYRATVELAYPFFT
jgi:putative NADH-flavin reductase